MCVGQEKWQEFHFCLIKIIDLLDDERNKKIVILPSSSFRKTLSVARVQPHGIPFLANYHLHMHFCFRCDTWTRSNGRLALHFLLRTEFLCECRNERTRLFLHTFCVPSFRLLLLFPLSLFSCSMSLHQQEASLTYGARVHTGPSVDVTQDYIT